MPYVIDLTVDIEAAPERVWRALTDPAAVVRWDTTVIAALDAPPDYPQPGQHVRWRCRGTSELLHDNPQHVEPNRGLHSVLQFGRQRLDETYTLEAQASSNKLQATDPDGTGHTTVYLHIDLTNHAPFIAGPVLLQLIDGPMTRRAFEASLTNLKYYCELSPD